MAHFIGIPLIISGAIAMGVALSSEFLIVGIVGAMSLLLAIIFYFRLLWKPSVLVALWSVGTIILSHQAMTLIGVFETVVIGFAMFAIGWILQFWGHFMEGNKPAFFEDFAYLTFAPLFVAQELLDAWYD
jgi:uncharacterized membrane protein YGL010W